MLSTIPLVALAALATLLGVPAFLPFARRHLASQTRAVPTAGGVVVTLAAALALAASTVEVRAACLMLLPVLLLALLSFVDDLRGLPVGARLIGHLVLASAVLWSFPHPDSIQMLGVALAAMPWVTLPLALLSAVWLVNLTNFMDGIDGLCSGHSAVACGALALLLERGGVSQSDPTLVWLWVCAGACLGFEAWNWFPARIFLGDTGSTVLGLSVAMGVARGAVQGIDIALLVLPASPFITDATATLGRRIWRGEPLAERHVTHTYQRLASHWGHAPVAKLYVGCAVVASGLALTLQHFAGSPAIPALAAGFIQWGLLSHLRRRQRRLGDVLP